MPNESPVSQSPASSQLTQGQKLFRGSALANRNAVDRVDHPLRIVPPIGWLTLATVGALFFVALVWSVLNHLIQSSNGNTANYEPFNASHDRKAFYKA